ncbi:hypothetical protein VTK26DRAFT_4732 [Humicola hyalothermophila]
MSTESNTAAAAAPAVKPTQPDQKAYEEGLAKLQKEHNAAMAKYQAIKAKIDSAVSDKNKDSPAQQRRKELIEKLNEIRQKQGAGKDARLAKQERIRKLEDDLRARIAEQKKAHARVPFKSTEEIDREIERLEREVNGGMMKLVDEKKALAEISNLRKQRKNFSQLDDAQKVIDEIRAKIKAAKEELEDPEAKALSEEYSNIQAELDKIKAEQDEVYNNLSALRKERNKLHAAQQETYRAIKKHQDEYHAARKAFVAWDRERRQKQREREQAERERIAKERRMERAKKMLEEASDPAYLEEIRRANSLLHFFDPTHPVVEKSPLVADKGLAAEAQRKVDDSGIKGVRLVSKKDRDDEYLPAVKKGGKKGKKSSHAADSNSKFFNCPPSVIADCAFVGVDPPMSAAEVHAVIEKIKAKLDHWKADQPEQTRKNIEKAKKEIERLEAEEAGSGASTPKNGVNGKKQAEKEEGDAAAAEAAEAVEKVSLKEGEAEPAAEQEEEAAEEAAPGAAKEVEAAA